MTASRNVKTPTMSVPFRSWVSEQQANHLSRSFSKLTLMDFLSGKNGVSVTERLEDDCGTWVRAIYITLKLHPAERIKAAFGLTLQDIARVVGATFVPKLSKMMKSQMRKASVSGEVAEVQGGDVLAGFEEIDENRKIVKNQPPAGDDSDEDRDDDPESVDGENDNKKNTYGEDFEDESSSDTSEEDGDEIPDFTEKETPSTFLNTKSKPVVRKSENEISMPGLRVEPDSTPLLMVGIVEDAAAATIVRQKQGIDQGFINEERGRGLCLQTAGVNFFEIFGLEGVDHERLESNDTWAIRQAYGVEAARSNIVAQIRDVFGVYGIEVDPRHLSMIADYMTFDGGYKAMSRIGIQDCSSSLQQMSFETTAAFLKSAALNGVTDQLSSPSASIVAGRPVKQGTGSFSLLSTM